MDYVIKNTRLYALRILKKAGLSQSELVNIYCSFIRSRIEYASPVCSSLTVYLSGVIESIIFKNGENPECRNITEYGGISRNMAEYAGISRNIATFSRNIPEHRDILRW